jgi:hypothetical protein
MNIFDRQSKNKVEWVDMKISQGIIVVGPVTRIHVKKVEIVKRIDGNSVIKLTLYSDMIVSCASIVLALHKIYEGKKYDFHESDLSIENNKILYSKDVTFTKLVNPGFQQVADLTREGIAADLGALISPAATGYSVSSGTSDPLNGSIMTDYGNG